MITLKQFHLSKIHTKIFFIILFVFLPLITFAQKRSVNVSQKKAWEQYQNNNGKHWKLRWNNKTGTPASLYGGKSKSYAGSFENKAKTFLKENMSLFNFENEIYVDNLVLEKTVNQNNGVFVRLQQTYNGIPVFSGEYIMRFDKDNKVTYAGGSLYNKFNLSLLPALSESEAIQAAKNYMNLIVLENVPYGTLVILPKNNEYYLCWKVILNEEPLKKWICFVDAQTGEVLSYNNIVSFAIGHGNAFLTNPGDGSYSSVTMQVEKAGIEYLLKNNIVTPLTSTGQTISNTTSDFYFYPPNYTVYDNTDFDMTNVLNHIYKYANLYIQGTLNYNITVPSINAKVHTSDDNAGFSPDVGELSFGQVLTGYYYDWAKSNEVIYHEYTHAILYNRIGIIGSSVEDGAMNEGYADYFACSYVGDPYWAEWLVKDHPSDYRRLNTDPQVFNYANYNVVTYPPLHPAGDIHTNGMIWSGALWDLRTELGQQLADELIFDGITYLTSTPTFLDGLNGIIVYDDANYNGLHDETIKSVFCNRGITFPENPSNLVLSGNPGEFVTLNWNPNTECNLTGYNIYRNYNFTGYQLLTNVNAGNTTYVDRGITIGNYHDPKVFYYVTATDALGQESAASNTVNTKAGGINKSTAHTKNKQYDEFELNNIYPNPFNPTTNIRFSLPNQSKVTISVYDLLGNKIKTLLNSNITKGIHSTIFDAKNLPSGIYIVQIKVKDIQTKKIFNQTQKITLIK